MKRESLLEKVENLRVNGDSRFAVANNDDIYEFKAIIVNGLQFKVFGGFGNSLSVYNNQRTSEDIVRDFEFALRVDKKTLESCTFTSKAVL